MADLVAIRSAYMQAQREVGTKLGYANPHAMPIAFRAIEQASEALTLDASNAAIVDHAFSGRLRGTVRKVLRQRHAL